MTNPEMSEADVTDRICSIQDCGRPLLARGVCNNHYKKLRKYGDPLYVVAYNKGKPCLVSGCERPQRRYSYCEKHSQRYMKYGTPELPERERPTCAGPECSRTIDPIQSTSGLCRSHYAQRHRGIALKPLVVATKNLGRPDVCEVETCDRPHKARGLCKVHNEWLTKGKSLEEPVEPRLPPGPCSVEDCQDPRFANGYCQSHNSAKVSRWRRHGISPDEAALIHLSQGSCCAICLKPADLEALSLDHDHDCCPGVWSCGECVRGLLCRNCNFGIGQLGDDVDRLRRAADYLVRMRKPD